MRRLAMLALPLLLAACSDAAAASPSEDAGTSGDAASTVDAGALDGKLTNDASTDAPIDAARTTCQGARDASTIAPVLFYNLRSAPFPGTTHPDVAVHVPVGFDGTRRPGLIVFFHGFDNCVANVMGSVDTPCTSGGAARDALHLVDQIDAAHVNAILVAVEIDFDQATGNPGQLTTPGNFHALLHELLTEHLNAVTGCALDVADLDRVVVSSHSGGYQAAAATIAHGQVAQLREIDLLDSLYGEIPTFDGWVHNNVKRFDPMLADELRWVDVYTSTGGTEANSRAMSASAAMWLSGAALSASYFDDDTTTTLAAADYAHPVVFKHSALPHGDVPKYYVQQLAQARGSRHSERLRDSREVRIRNSAWPVRGATSRALGSAERARGSADPARGSADPARSSADPARSSADPARSSAEPARGSADHARSSALIVRHSSASAQSSTAPARGSTASARGSTCASARMAPSSPSSSANGATGARTRRGSSRSP